jgi:hypothetical protein
MKSQPSSPWLIHGYHTHRIMLESAGMALGTHGMHPVVAVSLWVHLLGRHGGASFGLQP